LALTIGRRELETSTGKVERMYALILTFDVEDFTNDASLRALTVILKLLRKHCLQGLFFVTGHMAEKLERYPDVLELLESHEIGYHSSSHSVRPTIPEFTDVRSYAEAVDASLIRETSHINPLTGKPEREGGLEILRKIFDNKNIMSFRAPGFCWTPPHLEALQKLRIKFDFSAKLYGTRLLSETKISFKEMIFYPFPLHGADVDFWVNPIHLISLLSSRMQKRKIVCLSAHEWCLSASKPWDSIYFQGNPANFVEKTVESNLRSIDRFLRLDVFLKGIRILEKLGLLVVAPIPEEQGSAPLEGDSVDAAGTYHFSVRWARRYFGYTPRHVLSHFFKYFDQTDDYAKLVTKQSGNDSPRSSDMN
jgi:hypothetical protein